jgi:hypothetical protein
MHVLCTAKSRRLLNDFVTAKLGKFAVEASPVSRNQGRTLMGYASYLEDIVEKAHENRMMRGAYEDRVHSKPVYVPVSPPLQPTIAPMTPAVSANVDAETVAGRARALHEKHVLAIYELMPGRSWRH